MKCSDLRSKAMEGLVSPTMAKGEAAQQENKVARGNRRSARINALAEHGCRHRSVRADLLLTQAH
jgi:hypothetical protein